MPWFLLCMDRVHGAWVFTFWQPAWLNFVVVFLRVFMVSSGDLPKWGHFSHLGLWLGSSGLSRCQ